MLYTVCVTVISCREDRYRESTDLRSIYCRLKLKELMASMITNQLQFIDFKVVKSCFVVGYLRRYTTRINFCLHKASHITHDRFLYRLIKNIFIDSVYFYSQLFSYATAYIMIINAAMFSA